MSVFLWKWGITYFAVPKVACTSLKSMFFKIENGKYFENYVANGTVRHVHNAAYPTRTFDDIPHERIKGHKRMAVVRDPVERLLSCYSNRVLHYRELSAKKIVSSALAQHDLPADPSLEDFIANLNAYRAMSWSIDHHARPMVDFLGKDPTYFENIYAMKDIPKFVEEVSKEVGQELALERLQEGEEKIPPGALSSQQRGLIENYYSKDYSSFESYF